MRKKKAKTIIAAILVALLIAGMIVPILIQSLAQATTTQADIDRLRKELSGLSGDKSSLKKEISALAGQQATQERVRSNLDKEMDLTQKEIEVLTQLIEELERDLAIKTVQLEEANADVDRQYELLTKRMRASHEAGNLSYIEILLSSKSYTAFLTNMDVVSNILEYDRGLLDGLRDTLQAIDEAKQAVEVAKKEQEESKAQLDQKKQELQVKRDESDAAIKELEADRAAFEVELKKAEKEEAAVQAKINQMLRELAKTEYVGGTFAWPVPGVTRITDVFGPRVHPVTKKNSVHTGVDIAGPHGSKIVAANGGTVLIAGYTYAYGNYVVINHGGGYTTLYGHMSKMAVKEGQSVDKGQLIGYVGSTGLSTGNHCHFEIRKNGTPENPMNHFTKVG